jgi:hypothetical protein
VRKVTAKRKIEDRSLEGKNARGTLASRKGLTGPWTQGYVFFFSSYQAGLERV